MKDNLSLSYFTESMKDSKIVTSESFPDLFDYADISARVAGIDNVPEPTPIGPQGVKSVVPNLPLSHIREWKNLDNEENKVFIPTPTTEKKIDHFADHLCGIMNESISSIGFDLEIEQGSVTNQISATCVSDCSSSIDTVTSMESSNRCLSPQQFLQSGQWDERYQDLVQFRQEYGHSTVPHNYVQNIPLAQWVKR